MSEQSQTTSEGTQTTEGQTTQTDQTSQSTTTGDQSTQTTPPKEPSLLNKDEKTEAAKPVIPEKYADFKLPDGVKLDDKTLGEATTLFKELGLPQEGAQKLVDFHTKALASAAQSPVDEYANMVKGWGEKTSADPDIGPRMKEIKATIGKAYDALVAAAGDKGPAMRETVAEFKSIMDLTGVGNHLSFVKTFAALASAVVEGKHVAGSGPSSFGQGQQGGRPSAAEALYGQPRS